MDNNNDYAEKLIRYLDAELGEAESKALETELLSNPAMQQELDNLVVTKEIIKEYGITQKVKGIHETMMQEMTFEKESAKAVVRSMPKTFLRVAAGIMILIGLFGLYQYLTVSPGNLYNDQYAVYQVATMRGTTDNSNIEKAYGEKNNDKVILLYTQKENPNVNEQFLAAQAYLNVSDLNNAIVLFNTLIEKNKASNTGTLNDDAEYYLALSYLKNKETAKALPLLKKIHDNKDHLYHDRISSWYLAKVKLLNWKSYSWR